MALTGVDPNDPRPSTRRELVFAAGESGGSAGPGLVLLYGNKTTAGSEAANKIGEFIKDDSDAVARFGRRSELYQMFRKYVAIDKTATIYAIAVPEGVAATAATCTLTFATSATAVSTVEVSWGGEKVAAAVASGDDVTAIAAAVAKAINAADSGSWPVTATSALGVVTVTAANKGPRGGLVLARLTVRFTSPATTTVTKSAVVAGTVDDDFTDAYAEAATGVYEYQCIPCHATAAVGATDNQIGEGADFVKAQALPGVGKEQRLHVGLVGTQAEATAVATSGACNSPRVFFFHAENSPWTPAMLAAHHMAAVRSRQMVYPAANLNGYTATESTPYLVPEPADKADRPTPTEVIADLNNGICPVEFSATGKPSLTRFITSRSLNSQGENDYRAREGHITKCIDFSWGIVKQRWEDQKQPNIADDPAPGAKPVPLTSTPGQLKGIIWSVIDDLAGPMPLGIYPGPILAPDRVAKMKASVNVARVGAALHASADFEVVMHLLKSETTINETSPAY